MNDESNFFSFFFFLYYFCLVFFSRIDTLIFYSTLFSANIPLVVLPGMKNIGEKKFFLLLLAFLILLGFFTIPQKQCACTARKDLFLYFLQFFCSLSLSLPLCLSLSLYVRAALSSLPLLTLFSTATICNHHLFANKKRQV